jgi:hypothetical protein
MLAGLNPRPRRSRESNRGAVSAHGEDEGANRFNARAGRALRHVSPWEIRLGHKYQSNDLLNYQFPFKVPAWRW